MVDRLGLTRVDTQVFAGYTRNPDSRGQAQRSYHINQSWRAENLVMHAPQDQGMTQVKLDVEDMCKTWRVLSAKQSHSALLSSSTSPTSLTSNLVATNRVITHGIYTANNSLAATLGLCSSSIHPDYYRDRSLILEPETEVTGFHDLETDVLARGSGPSCHRKPISSMFDVDPTAWHFYIKRPGQDLHAQSGSYNP
jgi:hypothetical protein